MDRASQVFESAKAELAKVPDDQQKQAAVQRAQKAFGDAKQNLQEKQGKVEAVQKGMNDIDGKVG